MATKSQTKRAVPKKTQAKSQPERATVTKEQTIEDMVLGHEPQVEILEIYDYESHDIRYKVTNLKVKNKPSIVCGDVIETFIGSNNKEARQALKSGAKSVITKDYNKNNEYKIEVMK